MPGKNFQLTPLESRKQLLLIESELNRMQLINEFRDLQVEIEQVKDQLDNVGSIISSVKRLVTTASNLGDIFGSGEKKSSWMSSMINGAKTALSIWGTLRSRSK